VRTTSTRRRRDACSSRGALGLLRRHIVPCFGKAPVGRITPADVQGWLAATHSTHLSANTVAKAYRVRRGVLDGAVDVGLISRSPCTIKGAGTERHPEMQVALPDRVAALAAAVGPRWEAIVFAAAYTGLRWGELAGHGLRCVTSSTARRQTSWPTESRKRAAAARSRPGGHKSLGHAGGTDDAEWVY
jgi:integrase